MLRLRLAEMLLRGKDALYGSASSYLVSLSCFTALLYGWDHGCSTCSFYFVDLLCPKGSGVFLGEPLFTLLHRVLLGSLVSSLGDKWRVLYGDRQADVYVMHLEPCPGEHGKQMLDR